MENACTNITPPSTKVHRIKFSREQSLPAIMWPQAGRLGGQTRAERKACSEVRPGWDSSEPLLSRSLAFLILRPRGAANFTGPARGSPGQRPRSASPSTRSPGSAAPTGPEPRDTRAAGPPRPFRRPPLLSWLNSIEEVRPGHHEGSPAKKLSPLASESGERRNYYL